MTSLNEIDSKVFELITERNRKAKTTTKAQDFKDLVKQYKDAFGLEISTDYLKGLFLEHGKTKLQAENCIKKFICRNDIKPTKEIKIKTNSLKWFGGYGEETGFIKNDDGIKTICFF